MASYSGENITSPHIVTHCLTPCFSAVTAYNITVLAVIYRLFKLNGKSQEIEENCCCMTQTRINELKTLMLCPLERLCWMKHSLASHLEMGPPHYPSQHWTPAVNADDVEHIPFLLSPSSLLLF